MWRRFYALGTARRLIWGRKNTFLASSVTVRARHTKPELEQPTFERTPLSQLDIPSDSVQLRGRSHFPGAMSPGFPCHLLGPEENFPLGYTAINGEDYSLQEWSAACRKCIEHDLPKYGGLHFRDLPIPSVEQFAEFFTSLGYEPLDIVGIIGYRTKLNRHVFTASDDPKHYSIELHTESSHMHRFPLKFVMFCAREPEKGAGGETALAKVDEVTRNLDPRVLDIFRRKQVRYIGRLPDENMHDNRAQPWQDRFLTKDRKVAEEHFKALNISFEWLDCGTLRYWYTLPAVRPHPITGKDVWFNQALSHHASYLKVHPNFEDLDIPDDHYPFHTCYGDGTEFEPEVLQHIRDVSWSCARGYRWRTGDVIVLDNFAVMHSRLSFTGERRMVTSLTAN